MVVFFFFHFLNLHTECCFGFCFALKLFHSQIKDALFSAINLCSSAPVTFYQHEHSFVEAWLEFERERSCG